MLRQQFLQWFAVVTIFCVCQNVVTSFKESSTALGFRNVARRSARVRRDLSLNIRWDFVILTCIPGCRVIFVIFNGCGRQPTRYELCQAKLFLNLCCLEFNWSLPGPPSFKSNSDCTIPCVANRPPCPYPYCRLCRDLNYNHRCCNDAYDICPGAPSRPGPTTSSPEPTRPPTIAPGPGGGGSSTQSPDDLSSTTETPLIPPCNNVPDTVCQSFNGRPNECRLANGCAYNCEANSCQISEEVTGPCHVGCFNHCQDRCGCSQRPECSYDPVMGACKSRKRFCMLNDFSHDECSHKNGYYSVGGSICHMKAEMGDCSLDSTVIAVNLGSDEAVIDHNGIEYRPEKEFDMEDQYGISEKIEFSVSQIKAVQRSDAVMYSTAIVGSVRQCVNDSKLCVNYKIPTADLSGNYELAIRMVEGVYNKKAVRRFSIYFANIEVVSELDIFSFSGEQFRPLDVFVNFKVSDDGKTIAIKGLTPQPLQDPTMLSFCKGDCGTDNSFLVSGFHVIKQKAEDIPDPCLDEPIDNCRKEDFTTGRCVRANGFYSFGGVLCKNQDASGNCYVTDTLAAVNFYGQAIKDSRGIGYSPDETSNVDDPDLIKLGKVSTADIQGAAAEDKGLYQSLMYGDLQSGAIGSCVLYPVVFCEDGNYELAVRLMDDESTSIRNRKFNVYFGSVPIFPEIDVFALTGQISTAADVMVHFKVSKNVTRLRLKGVKYSIAVPQDQSVPVKFCFSNCSDVTNINFLAAGFSVVKFGTPIIKGRNSVCSGLTTPCSCRFQGTCEYIVDRNECVDRDEVCTIPCGSESCYRGGIHIFYLHGGAICGHHRHTRGNCQVEQVVLAINFNGDAHRDVNGIDYQPDKGIPFDDPDKTKTVWVSNIIWNGLPTQDLDLYSYHIYGQNDEKAKKNCTTYKVPTAGDGKYELSIKVGEPYYTSGIKRAFSYKFNGVFLVKEFAPSIYRSPPFGMDLNLNFEVVAGGASLKMKGYEDTSITEGSIPLSFCFGECELDKIDINWVIGAFSVVKFKS